MYNDSKSISANEINKFTYCPYQWYYERYYGSSHIRQLYKERNEALGVTNNALSNFKRGLDYHANYNVRQPGSKLRNGLYLVAALAGIACALWFYYNFSIKL